MLRWIGSVFVLVVFLSAIGFLLAWLVKSENADVDRICALPRVTVRIQEGENILAVVRESVGEEIWNEYGEDLFAIALKKLNHGDLKPGMEIKIPTRPVKRQTVGRRVCAGRF